MSHILVKTKRIPILRARKPFILYRYMYLLTMFNTFVNRAEYVISDPTLVKLKSDFLFYVQTCIIAKFIYKELFIEGRAYSCIHVYDYSYRKEIMYADY